MKTDIARLLKNGENDQVEFKRKLIERRHLMKLIIAMANTNGGQIIIGVGDNGEVLGIEKEIKYLEQINELSKIIGQNNYYKLNVKAEFIEMDGKTLLIISVPKAEAVLFDSTGNFLIRNNGDTIESKVSRQLDGTKVFEEQAKISYIKEFNVPENLSPGQECVVKALKVGKHSKVLRVTYHWEEESVIVVGAHMVKPNIFEFPASEKDVEWNLKFIVSKDFPVECEKELYITVDEIITNKKIYIFAKVIAYILIALSFVPLFSSFFNINNTFAVLTLGSYISIPLPIITIISILLLSKRVTVVIDRLANVKLSTQSNFNEKAISTSINKRVIKIKKV